MPYPKETPQAKHDFLIFSEEELSSGEASEVFAILDAPIDPHKLIKNSAVYSYPDGPRHPGPISRSLTVVGLLEVSHPAVQKLLIEQQANGVMEKCTIGVKQLSLPNLKDTDKVNSANFAKFITKLRRQVLVAVLNKDKYGRFGLLRPMEGDDDEKFAADCFIGDMKRAKDILGPEQSATAATASAVEDVGAGTNGGLWQPPGTEEETADSSSSGLWQPPGSEEAPSTFGFTNEATDSWQPSSSSSMMMDTTRNPANMKRSASEMNNANGASDEDNFHSDIGAATADKFYSGLTRTLDTRSDSRLYHMRAFNGWVKATQIQELNPHILQPGKKKRINSPLRVLDLACGKGGDLGKWILHQRRMSNYVGVDVARGSLKDAAIRARGLRNKMERCTFTCADLGADVPGRLASAKKKQMQKLLSWSLLEESEFESGPPVFKRVRGGGVLESDKFDVVSIQFAIHYMMSTKKRARRFFRTVGQLLEIGGNLIATTIDARVVMEHLMNLGEDLHFDSEDEEKEDPHREIVVTVGGGACRIRFQRHIVKKIFTSVTRDDGKFNDNVFGLEYVFTLQEGSDHAAGVGEAVDLPEWLTPIPVLKELAEEAGLKMDYGVNFHEFFEQRKDPQTFPAAHLAIYNMKVLNKDGSISADEWEISRLYCAVKFTKVREAEYVLDEDEEGQSDDSEDDNKNGVNVKSPDERTPAPAAEKPNSKFFMKALMAAKMTAGKDKWESLPADEKNRLTQLELAKLAPT